MAEVTHVEIKLVIVVGSATVPVYAMEFWITMYVGFVAVMD
jgi:hypothetical protein